MLLVQFYQKSMAQFVQYEYGMITKYILQIHFFLRNTDLKECSILRGAVISLDKAFQDFSRFASFYSDSSVCYKQRMTTLRHLFKNLTLTN